jgi:hypothetical protein
MRVVRVGPLPEGALEAAAEFHARVVPELDPPRNGEGDRDAKRRGGGGSPQSPRSEDSPHHHPSDGPPPRAGEDLALVFTPVPHDHRGWRLAAVQDLARAAAPARVNGVVGDDEQAIAETIAWLERSPGVTGQLLAIEPG